ncbi:MAG: YtxH domain-containing protein [Dehalococcoidales bacterium]|nr:YtxH domain-containing protein [Dehalococcoidales bacterium]
MSENRNASGFGMGLLAGVAVGLAIGALYAPHSGKETRTLLKKRAQEAECKAEEILAGARQRAKKIVDNAREPRGHATEFKPEEEAEIENE